MPPHMILDTHIHLWPTTALSPTSHGWMTPGHNLTKRHGISDYLTIASPPPTGFVYIETDRYLPSASPAMPAGASESETIAKLEAWAKQPLEEIRYLRRIAEGSTDAERDGVSDGEGAMMKGAVLWAPFHLPPAVFTVYMQIAQRAAGSALWDRVGGFRYLLQGKAEGQVEKLVRSEAWISNIVSLSKGRNGRGWVFDVGVDTHRDGLESLEVIGDMLRDVREREGHAGQHVRFVLNHLCKPPLSHSPSPRWTSALQHLGSDPNVFMKLSGAFNEFENTPSCTSDMLKALHPFVDVIFSAFPQRVMFASDWPVCNVGGPRGESGNWMFWVEVVQKLLEERNMDESEKESVWWRAGAKAYGVEL